MINILLHLGHQVEVFQVFIYLSLAKRRVSDKNSSKKNNANQEQMKK
jgi:hypothetical protein